MTSQRSAEVHVLEFGCQAPLKFYEHCKSCPRFGDDCEDLALGIEILKGKKKLAYGGERGDNLVAASTFRCLAPLYYFEKTRSACGHQGRCREEGLLLALLTGKRILECSDRQVISITARKRARAEAAGTAQAARSTK